MPDWLSPYLSGSHPVFYPAVFSSILLAGLCFPISTDLVLLTCGYLVYRGQADAPLLIVISILAILIADSLMFWIGSKFGTRVLRKWPFNRAFTDERLVSAQASFQKYGYGVVFAARFMPGIRTIFMFTSGVLRLRWLAFIACDAAGALIVVPAMIYVVGIAAGNREQIGDALAQGQWILLGIVVVIVGWLTVRKKHKLIEPARSLADHPPEITASSSTPPDPVDLRE